MCWAVAGVSYVPLARSTLVTCHVLLIYRMWSAVSLVGVCAKGQGTGCYRLHPKAYSLIYVLLYFPYRY